NSSGLWTTWRLSGGSRGATNATMRSAGLCFQRSMKPMLRLPKTSAGNAQISGPQSTKSGALAMTDRRQPSTRTCRHLSTVQTVNIGANGRWTVDNVVYPGEHKNLSFFPYTATHGPLIRHCRRSDIQQRGV